MRKFFSILTQNKKHKKKKKKKKNKTKQKTQKKQKISIQFSGEMKLSRNM